MGNRIDPSKINWFNNTHVFTFLKTQVKLNLNFMRIKCVYKDEFIWT